MKASALFAAQCSLECMYNVEGRWNNGTGRGTKGLSDASQTVSYSYSRKRAAVGEAEWEVGRAASSSGMGGVGVLARCQGDEYLPT